MPNDRLVIIGNYGATNVGDEAVLAGLLVLACEKYTPANITVLSYDPLRTTAEHGCASVPLLPFGFRSLLRWNWWPSLRSVSRASQIWIGGGALFTDEKIFAVLLWGWHVVWGRLLCGRVSLVANTVGPIRTSFGRLLMRVILRLVHAASVRDAESEHVLRRLGFAKNIIIAADPAFLIEPVVRKADTTKTIIVSLRPWIHQPPQLLPDLAAWIDERAAEGYRITLLPFQTMHDDDRIILSQLYTLVENKEHVDLIEKAEDLPAILRRIASAELMVGMRLHSLILSAIQGTPFIGLSYSDKVANFCRSVSMQEYCMDMAQWDRAMFSTRAAHLLETHQDKATMLAAKRQEARQAALRTSPEA